MSQIANMAGIVTDLLRGQGGLQSNIDTLSEAEQLPRLHISDRQYMTQNLPADLSDRTSGGKYPCIHVYCEKVTNRLREKSRVFSGDVGMAIEIRASSDRPEGLDAQLHLLVDAVTGTLEQNRGDWGAGVFFGGAYEVLFTVIKHGGRNFLQTAKITFDLQVSR